MTIIVTFENGYIITYTNSDLRTVIEDIHKDSRPNFGLAYIVNIIQREIKD